jgi:hypothetical protein
MGASCFGMTFAEEMDKSRKELNKMERHLKMQYDRETENLVRQSQQLKALETRDQTYTVGQRELLALSMATTQDELRQLIMEQKSVRRMQQALRQVTTKQGLSQVMTHMAETCKRHIGAMDEHVEKMVELDAHLVQQEVHTLVEERVLDAHHERRAQEANQLIQESRGSQTVQDIRAEMQNRVADERVSSLPAVPVSSSGPLRGDILTRMRAELDKV